VKVSIVGGTGPFGRGLGTRLAAAGDDVVIGSRDAERARATAAELGVAGATNAESLRGADLVVLAVKADAAPATARELADALGGTPLLCVASALKFGKDGVRPASNESVAGTVAALVAAPVVAGLHSLAASTLAGGEPPEEDALVCGDDAEAKALALELASKVVAGRALDAGPLDNACALEGMTAVIVNLNRRYKGHAGIRITGLP
jgi:8-hydroxy-5-deazaflavin:NADPH oxidoreductase